MHEHLGTSHQASKQSCFWTVGYGCTVHPVTYYTIIEASHLTPAICHHAGEYYKRKTFQNAKMRRARPQNPPAIPANSTPPLTRPPPRQLYPTGSSQLPTHKGVFKKGRRSRAGS